jgi:hypothetical protein
MAVNSSKYESLFLGVCVMAALVLWRGCSVSKPREAGAPGPDTPVQESGDAGAGSLPSSEASFEAQGVPSAKAPEVPQANAAERPMPQNRSSDVKGAPEASLDSTKAIENAPIPELPSTPAREPVAFENLQVPRVEGSSGGNPKNAAYPTKPPEKPSGIVIWKEPPQKNTSTGASQSLHIPEPPARK